MASAPELSGFEKVHRELVERIAAELTPVRRVWPVSTRLWLWILLEAAVLLLWIWHGYRSDLPEQLRNPWYLLGVVGFTAAALIAATRALRAAIPGRESSRLGLILMLALAVSSALLLFHEPIDEQAAIATFIGRGIPCATGILILAAIPWLAMLWAIRRGAPLRAAAEGGLAGAAAMLFSFALIRLRCPLDERLHLLVWHLMPALIGTALSACLGAVILRRRRPL